MMGEPGLQALCEHFFIEKSGRQELTWRWQERRDSQFIVQHTEILAFVFIAS